MNYELWTTYREIRNTLYENRESSYLRAYKAPVICFLSSVVGTSTSVENPLQISLFMQNKPNLPKSQMNINPYNTTDYENKSNWTLGENKPKQTQFKPNPSGLRCLRRSPSMRRRMTHCRTDQTQFPKSQNERKLICYRGLQKKRWFRSPKKQTQSVRPALFVKESVDAAPDDELPDWSKPALSAVEWANLESTLKGNAILDDTNYGRLGRCWKN